jgi:hypothetical protein
MNAPVDPTDILGDLRFSRDCEALHRQGPGVLYRFLVELGQERFLRTDLEIRTRRWAGLTPEAIEITGAARLPKAPIWGVPQS